MNPVLSGIRWPNLRLGLVLVISMAILLVAVACDTDDDDDADDAETPAPTPEATPDTPEPEDTPTPADPEDPEADLEASLEMIADDLTAPVDLAAPDDGSGRVFIVEQGGLIHVVSDGEMMDEPFIDLSDRIVELREGFDERGTLGLAFHPDYADNSQFYVYYSAPLRDGAPDGWDHTSVISEFTVSDDDENAGDPDSERVILEVDQPQFNHNAGHIRFGHDGYLYVPLGDGGGAHDIEEGHTPDIGNGQDRTNLLGSILRIDVDDEGDGERAYGIPDDNPLVDEDEGEPEIWAYGLRNPYDINFDPDEEFGLLIADAGQALFEIVHVAYGGENFGWNIKEGTHCFDSENPEDPPAECPDEGAWGEPLVDPVVEYSQEEHFGDVIVGSVMYRGTELAGLQDMLIFAEWNVEGDGNGGIYAAEPGDVNGELWDWEQVHLHGDEAGDDGLLGMYITLLGQDANGDLYVFANDSSGPEEGAGVAYRLVPADNGADEE